MSVKIPRDIFRYVEHELYNFDNTKEEIQAMREDIFYSSPAPGVTPLTSTNSISDTTGKKAVSLVSSRAISHMARIVNSIEGAFSRLNEDHLLVFELKYQQRYSWQRVCDEIPMTRTTFFRVRRELIFMVAYELGLVTAWEE
jgi:RinA family phage transcriptional activator